MERIHGLDLYRLIAAFFIMFLHTSYKDFYPDLVFGIKLTARWAVPFFFIVSGFFLGNKIDDCKKININKIQNKIVWLMTILIIASLIYLPLEFFYNNFPFHISNILTGSTFHLWFIGSLLFGHLSIWYFYKINKHKFLLPLSFIIVIMALFSDSYDAFLGMEIEFNFARFCLSIPLMCLGIHFQKKKHLNISKTVLVIFIFLGIIIQLLEGFWIQSYLNYQLFSPQFLIGTLLIAVPLFLYSIKIDIKENVISTWGRNHSLFIYLYHLIAYQFISFVLARKILGNIEIPLILIPIIGFIITLATAIFLKRNMRVIYNTLNGQIALKSD